MLHYIIYKGATTIMLADLHIHTTFSPDSNAPMEDYIRLAIERNIDILCFTDHVESGGFFKNYTTFPFAQRAELFHTLKARYGSQIKLLLGVEFGEPHLYPQQLAFVHSLGLDMIIGSIHQPMDTMFNRPDGKDGRYYEQMYGQWVLDMINSGGFDVVGHIDMPKRYNDDYVANIPQLQQIMRACVANNLVPEINVSSTIRKGLPPMPDMDIIAYYHSMGGRYVTVNTDSHTVGDVGKLVPEISSQLPQGIKRCYFENRQLIEIV